MIFKLSLLVLAILVPNILTDCAFTVLDMEAQVPSVPVDPTPYIRTSSACPFYTNTLMCCNDVQDQQMHANFQSIDATFGSPGGGCDICSANLKRFWCEYTCNPNQASFVKVLGNGEVPDPSDSSKRVTVQLVDITLQPQLACDVWSSCARTQFASQVSAMQSPGGFFNFQGTNAVSQAKQYITSSFSTEDGALGLNDVTPCNTQLTNKTVIDDVTTYYEPFGFAVLTNCSCNNCDLTCSKETNLYQPTGLMEGFEYKLVIGVWIAVVFICLVISIYSKIKSKRKLNLVDNNPLSQPLNQQT